MAIGVPKQTETWITETGQREPGEWRNWQASSWTRFWSIAEKQFSVAQDKMAIGMPKVNGDRADRDK